MPDNLGYTPGTGATLRSLDIGGVHYPAGTLFDAAGNVIASATGIPGGSDRGLVVRPAGVQTQYGNVRVSAEPHSLLAETFDTLDTAVRWFPVTSAAGYASAASGAAIVDGEFVFSNLNVNAAWAALVSRFTFGPLYPAFVQGTFGVKLEVPTASAFRANAIRFWGFGTAPATPSAATPITDGYGFETTAAGVLRAVIYTNGVVTQAVTIAAPPTDGGYHRYGIQARSDRVFFFIDDSNAPVATISWPSLYVQVVPMRLQHVTSGAVSGAVFSVYGLGVGDTGGNITQIGDATNPARRAAVTNATPAAADPGLVVRPAGTVTVQDVESATGFYSTADSTLAALKVHWVIVNEANSGLVYRLRLVVVQPTSNTVSGALPGSLLLTRRALTNTPVGSMLLPHVADTADPVPLPVMLTPLTTNPTGSTSTFVALQPQPDELKVTTLDAPTMASLQDFGGVVLYAHDRLPNTRPITARPGQTLEVVQGSPAGAGAVRFVVVLTAATA